MNDCIELILPESASIGAVARRHAANGYTLHYRRHADPKRRLVLVPINNECLRNERTKRGEHGRV